MLFLLLIYCQFISAAPVWPKACTQVLRYWYSLTRCNTHQTQGPVPLNVCTEKKETWQVLSTLSTQAHGSSAWRQEAERAQLRRELPSCHVVSVCLTVIIWYMNNEFALLISLSSLNTMLSYFNFFYFLKDFNRIDYIFNASIYIIMNLYSVLSSSGWLSYYQPLFSIVTTSTGNASMIHKPTHYSYPGDYCLLYLKFSTGNSQLYLFIYSCFFYFLFQDFILFLNVCFELVQ
jgi:hypothetical protein